MYGVTAMFFFFVGGFEALLIRAQLAGPNGTILSADKYNQMFTMHATTMVFLFVMPMAPRSRTTSCRCRSAPVTSRSRASTRSASGASSSAASSSTRRGSSAAPPTAAGSCTPRTRSVPFSPTNGIDFWTLGLQITGIASLTGAINLIVTVLNMRAPGMSLMKMPIFTWMILVVQFLLLFAMPVITVALFLLMFQRSSTPRSSTSKPAPTRCCGSTCSGSSATPRCTS
jgi:cytochrome c oxidase subunit I